MITRLWSVTVCHRIEFSGHSTQGTSTCRMGHGERYPLASPRARAPRRSRGEGSQLPLLTLRSACSTKLSQSGCRVHFDSRNETFDSRNLVPEMNCDAIWCSRIVVPLVLLVTNPACRMGWEAATLVGGFRSGEAFPKNPKRVYFAKVPFPSISSTIRGGRLSIG